MREKGIINRREFRITQKWFLERNRRTFLKYVEPVWAGKPISYLEIGVFEGVSLVWMMQYILTHPKSRAVGIDPWLQTWKLSAEMMDVVRERAFFNTSRWSDRCQLIRGNSDEILRRMTRRWGYAGIRKGSVNLSMVDGNHNALAVWADAQWVYLLLKVGGWMLFDDVENQRGKTNHVKEGVRLFMQEVGDKMRLLWKDEYMECYIKVS